MDLRRDTARGVIAALFVAFACGFVAAPAIADSPADEALTRARRAAAADRHREAIHWYLAAIDQAPELRSELGLELGHQYTWADSPDTAIVWYRLYLDEHPGDLDAGIGVARALSWSDRLGEAFDAYRALLPGAGARKNEVRLGIATVLSWQDKLWPARAVYEEILAEEPDNLEARVGRARVINWAGRHREARGLFAELLDEHPDNPEVCGGLAAAYNWMGRPDRAVDVLDAAPRDSSLAALEREIRRGREPAGSYIFSHNEDSDDIERDTHTVRGEASPAWLTRVGLQYARGEIQQPGLPRVTRDAVQVSLAQRFSEAVALTMKPGYEWNSFDRGALGAEPFWQDGLDLFTLDAYLTVTPIDWVRADLGVFRGSIDNPVPVYRGVDVVETSAGVDWRLAPTVLTVTAASWTDYSDDNARLFATEKVEWKPVQRLPVPIRHRFTTTTGVAYYDFDKTLDHGYYNPNQYLSLYEVVGVEAEFGKRLRVEVNGRVAADRENSDDWFSGGSFGASASLRTAGGVTVSAGYYNSRSRFDTRAGYEADGFWVGLER